jgi:hypothetical protein
MNLIGLSKREMDNIIINVTGQMRRWDYMVMVRFRVF